MPVGRPVVAASVVKRDSVLSAVRQAWNSVTMPVMKLAIVMVSVWIRGGVANTAVPVAICVRMVRFAMLAIVN